MWPKKASIFTQNLREVKMGDVKGGKGSKVEGLWFGGVG